MLRFSLIFDSHYDAYRAIVNIRIMQGTVKPGDKIHMMATGKDFEVLELGVFTPKISPRDGVCWRRRLFIRRSKC